MSPLEISSRPAYICVPTAGKLLGKGKERMEHAATRAESIIETVNGVNSELCKTVGDFFLEWGIPGRNYWKENGLTRPED